MAEYERLTTSIEHFENDFCGDCAYNDDFAGCTRGGCDNWLSIYPIYERLRKLEDKIEQGTLVELPCKIGDTVYLLPSFGNDLLELNVIGVEIACCVVWIRGKRCDGIGTVVFLSEDFNHTVFATKTEAKRRLAELKKGEQQ